MLTCSDVNFILVGTNGRVTMFRELLKAFSGAKPDEPGKKKKPSFASKFRKIATEHNKRWKEKRKS